MVTGASAMSPPSSFGGRLFVRSLLLAASAALGYASSNATLQLQQYDSLRVGRCSVHCWDQPPDIKVSCESACLRSHYTKAGSCPDASTLSAFDVACIDACSGDNECSATDKCCRHTCGVTCQRAHGLDAVPGLPAVPHNIQTVERRHGRVVVEWQMPEEPTNPVEYVLEERHHVGRIWSADRLGGWVPRHRSSRPCATLQRGVLRPGRWYQFRVASVNSNGSRGFSEPSRPFRLNQAVPRAPGPPLNLTVGAASSSMNGSVRAVMRWDSPVSDMPVYRYKVFWSRRLEGASRSQGSVLVHHQTVAGDVHRFILKALEPDSLYFLQVQAISQFGRERLKSEKAAIFLNTGNVTKTESSS